jgi:hypothetical protein
VSPTKRPSAVDSLRRAAAPVAPAAPASTPPDEPKARVTLNLPASMYRDIERWSTEAADALGVPRVSVQDALRAMIRATILDKSIGLVAIDLLRRDQSG